MCWRQFRSHLVEFLFLSAFFFARRADDLTGRVFGRVRVDSRGGRVRGRGAARDQEEYQRALRAPTEVDLVRWVTAGGDDVLGLRTGRLRVGYPADVSVFRLNDIAHMGMHDHAAGFLSSAATADVVLSLCAGRVICERGEVPGLDLDELCAQAREATQRLGRVRPIA